MTTAADTITIADFIAQHRITMDCEYASENPNMGEWQQANHYKVTLRANGRQMTTYFSQGLGITHEPTLADVLDCLAVDAADTENARTFEEWCDEYGYDTDSRKAERTYKACQKNADKLNNLLGDAYTDLLWHTERL